jgi:hypothetical protein
MLETTQRGVHLDRDNQPMTNSNDGSADRERGTKENDNAERENNWPMDSKRNLEDRQCRTLV